MTAITRYCIDGGSGVLMWHAEVAASMAVFASQVTKAKEGCGRVVIARDFGE